MMGKRLLETSHFLAGASLTKKITTAIIFVGGVAGGLYVIYDGFNWMLCGPDIGETRFEAAVLSGDSNAVENAVCRSRYLDMPLESNGTPPLLKAIEQSNKGVVDVLIQNGANLDYPSNGESTRALWFGRHNTNYDGSSY